MVILISDDIVFLDDHRTFSGNMGTDTGTRSQANEISKKSKKNWGRSVLDTLELCHEPLPEIGASRLPEIESMGYNNRPGFYSFTRLQSLRLLPFRPGDDVRSSEKVWGQKL